MKNNKNIYQDTLTVNGKMNLRELARLTLLNILSVRGVIYTHYKNKSRFRHNEKHLLAIQESPNE